jgi:GTPase SAR1 family protein
MQVDQTYNIKEENKIYVIGDKCAGKYNLLSHFFKTGFSSEPHRYQKDKIVIIKYKSPKKNIEFTFKLIPDPNSEQLLDIFNYEKEGVKCILLVFSLLDKQSFDVIDKFAKTHLVFEHNYEVPVLLVGTKYDLVSGNNDLRAVKQEDVNLFIGDIHNYKYLEVSNKTGYGLELLDKEIEELEELDDENEEEEQEVKKGKDKISCVIF